VARTVLACAALAVFALPCRADQATSDGETVIRLTVDPAAVPRPALRYVLLPRMKEMNPGNPIQGYTKCFMEQQKFFFDKESVQRREKLRVMPLKELPARELQDYGGFALKQADRAARLDNPDWQVLVSLKADGIGLMIPDVQALRHLAAALKVRFRAEVALGRFDEAIGTAKTLFAMSRHLGEHPTFVGHLVGIAVADVAIGPLEEMLEQPGCPNLYWALTNLPDPLIPLDRGVQGDRVGTFWIFRDLDHTSPMSAEQIEKFIANKDELFGDEKTHKPGTMRAWLDARARDEGTVRAARRRLVEHGIPEQRLSRFPAAQVILLDEERELEIRYDDTMKLVNLPAWQFEALAARRGPGRQPALFADALMPAVDKVRRRQARLDQRIALLRHVEALRLHAAEHDGRFPATLSEVSVPLPDDPVTGKPFRYEVDGATAHLRGSPPRDEEKNPDLNVHYQVILRK